MTGMFNFCNIPEADGVPVTVERLEVLFIVNPLFARRTNGQTSSSWNNSNTMRQRKLQSRGQILVFNTCPLHPSISELFCRVVRLAQYCADRFISLLIPLIDSHNLSPLPSFWPHFINTTYLCCLHGALLHLLQWGRINYPFKHTQTLCVTWLMPGASHTSQILTGLPRAGEIKKH